MIKKGKFEGNWWNLKKISELKRKKEKFEGNQWNLKEIGEIWGKSVKFEEYFEGNRWTSKWEHKWMILK